MTAAFGMIVTKVTQINSKIKKLVEDLLVLVDMKSPSVKNTDKYKRNIIQINPIRPQSPPDRETFG
jgi:hypothetical protein